MNNLSRTANNAIQYKGTLSKCLDLFAGIGAMRHQNVDTVISIFKEALHENIELSLKILFWARSCRGGAGERLTFKVILEHVCDVYPEFVVQNIPNIVKYGYWKDLVRFTESDVPDNIRNAIVNVWSNNIALEDLAIEMLLLKLGMSIKKTTYNASPWLGQVNWNKNVTGVDSTKSIRKVPRGINYK